MLWQHLFWFMGHPEVYIMALPAFGIVSEVIPVFARKPIFGYRAIAAATAAIGFLGVMVWAHHMFATPLPLGVLGFFMVASFAVAVPTGIKIFNWIATLWRGNIEFRVPLLFAVGLVAQFALGGMTGVILAVFPVDWQLTDTYFVVGHMHHVLFGGTAFGIMAGLYYWFPKMSGRMLSEGLGKVSFWLMVIGFNATFLPQYSAGLSGMPRRVVEYGGSGLTEYNVISTVGSFVLAAGVLVTVFNVVWSLRKGRRAGPDPWLANTLEWFTPSPPPEHDFDVIPTVRSLEPMKDIRRSVQEREAVLAGDGEVPERPSKQPEPIP
jgi:cytochrome c oxidase subunit I